MLRVAEQYTGTDTGRQRRANEDSMLARPPLFVVADGMGGAQAGEVASRLAVESFQDGLPDTADAEGSLAAYARAANVSIHELSQANAEHAGMGTTLTAVYVGAEEVAIAHVGDSRAYCLRGGALLRLTDDHSLVDELIRQGKLTAEEAVEHPQRSVITRALGPEPEVEIDTRSYRARDGDVYLLCSDGLTTMVSDEHLAGILLAHPRLRDAGEALIAAANEAGGRDNITVVLLRVEEVQMARAAGAAGGSALGDGPVTLTGIPALPASASVAQPPRAPSPLEPRQPPLGTPPGARRSRRLRRAATTAVVLGVLAVLGVGAYVASQSVYFIGTNSRGLVTLFNGFPYELPGGVKLYSKSFVSGVSASTLSPVRRRTLLDQTLRSEGDARDLMHSLELGQLE
ncbi:MAG TPA: Stp1/IreP family PP2C-type Ser/Thr phosphatase [Solirubrobacteraceae bacterium]|nr:Stp1/IreP family PP2C-type Ser/Thr phosphatase [Solirubrobacteraceae bacterium]